MATMTVKGLRAKHQGRGVVKLGPSYKKRSQVVCAKILDDFRKAQDGVAAQPFDAVIEAVRNDLLLRSRLGQLKYGVGIDRTNADLRAWLQHAYEEALDMANYLKRSILEWDRINGSTKD